jgi:4-hydroxy-tetrahydrodipicolinate reductase
MKIALIGYGKMGHEIEQVAITRGHEIILKIDENNQYEFTKENLANADVAIEFTTPHSAVSNILKCFEASVPVVSGTTGWMDKMTELKSVCHANEQAFFYASNFSIGVNLFMKLNEYLATLMQNYSEYIPTMVETHHTQKKDAPSGTAISLAEGLIKNHKAVNKWILGKTGLKDELPIQSVREGNVPGIHTINYTSEVDEIVITHNAFSRKGFALGAVHAAEWIIGKKGVFGMKDMLESTL